MNTFILYYEKKLYPTRSYIWYPDKIPPEKSLWMQLSANLFRLESSIIMRAKQVTNPNNVATEKRSYFLNKNFTVILIGGILSGGFYPETIIYLTKEV